MKKLSLQEVQAGTEIILKKIDEICIRNNINYTLIYGTLIGAIRHGGFIPWDDDLDIAMPRDDYEKFLFYCYEHAEELNPFVLHNTNTVENYPYYISRFCDERYSVKFEMYPRYNSGLFVDIYPLDAMGGNDDLPHWREVYKKCKYYKKALDLCCRTTFINGNTTLSKILNLPIQFTAKLRGKEFYIKRLDELTKYRNWDESDYVGLPTWCNTFHYLERKDFKSYIRVKFGNIEAQCCSGYDNVLKKVYGDYMKLPPVDKQKPSHSYDAYLID